MTLLITSARVDTLAEVETLLLEVRRTGADAVELRVDTFREPPERLRGFLLTHHDPNWIVTCRGRREGGLSDASPEHRADTLARIVRDTTACVDFEFADWRTSEPARQTLISSLAEQDRMILSAHDFHRPFDDPDTLVAQMLAEPHVRAAKIAFHARDAGESLAAFDLMRRFGHRLCAMAMGVSGTWTRILARKFNAWATYGARDAAGATAPGQLPVGDMIERFRWPAITPATRVYGVIGDPIAHSLSPITFNDWFAAHDVDGVYLPLHVPGGADGLSSFLDGVRARPWLDLGGFSVTLPHKEHVLRWCGGAADSMARFVGASNTLVTGADRFRAFNTDCYAALDSLCEALPLTRRDLAKLRIDVLGAGGVARAIVYGLMEYGCRGTIYARTYARAAALAHEFGFEAAPWEQRLHRTGDVVINATSVGLWPDVDQTPLPAEALDDCRLVFDTIYNPLETALLREARARGIKTRNGLDMFIRQAAMQFELFTGRRPDTKRTATLLRSVLSRTPTPPDSRMTPPLRSVRGVRAPSIVLIGLRGAGKTTVGRALAERLGLDFVDTDERIAGAAGTTIAQLFVEEGEAGFRRRERRVIEQVVAERPAIISVGGGALLDPVNVEGLRQVGSIVWLTAPVAMLWERVSHDSRSASTRPPLTAHTGLRELEQLSRDRAVAYERAADITIDTADKPPERIAEEIVRKLGLDG